MICGILLAIRQEEGLKRLAQDGPAAMIRLCGKPAAQYGLELMGRSGMRRALLLTDGPCPEAEESFGGTVLGSVAVQVARTGEDTSLAAIKKAARPRDNLVILDGTVIAEIPLREALRTHRLQKADVTLVQGRQKDLSDVKPLEGPAVVVLSPRAVSKLPPKGEPVSALWDWMASEGLRVQTLELTGMVLQLKEEKDIFACHSYLLRESRLCGPQPRDSEGNIILSRIPSDCRITPPVYVGKNVQIGRGVELGGGCVLEDYTLVGGHSSLENVTVTTGTVVQQSTSASCGILCPDDAKSKLPLPVFLTQQAMALGTLYRGRNLAVGCASMALYQSTGLLICGALASAGAHTRDFGVCTWGGFIHGFGPKAADAGFYVTENGLIRSAPAGLPFSSKVFSEYQKLLRLDSLDAAPAGFGGYRMTDGVEAEYARLVHSAAPKTLWGTRCRVICADEHLQRMGNGLLQQLGCRPGGDKLVLDALGQRGQLQCEDGKVFTWDDILTVLCAALLEKGRDVALPDDVAPAAESLMTPGRGKVLRYHAAPGRSRDAAARSLAMDQLWTRDALLAGVAFLSQIQQGGRLLTTVLMSKYNKSIPDNLCKLH